MNRLQKAVAVLLGIPTRKRLYESARPSRTTSGWYATTSSADAEINSSLTSLRGRSRSLVRDSGYAKRAREIVVNNVIGTGIGIQAQIRTSRDELYERGDTGIEDAWCYWCAHCHTGGALHFADFERMLMAQIFETGEVFVRIHERAVGDSEVPLALEIIESERVPHEFRQIAAKPSTRMGIEVDEFFRPLGYWVQEQHPNDIGLSMISPERVFRVPAEQMIHMRIIERWPQTRGVPWLHAAAKQLNNMNGYSDAEITAARGAANYMAHQETSDLDDPDVEQQEDGTYETTLEPGIITRGPGKMDFFAPNRPNSQLDPFMRYMLREVAAAVGVSYESLSRDYSQSNYSSSRLALLDDRDLWRVLQGWFIRTFREPIHRLWLPRALLAGAVEGVTLDQYAANPKKYEAVKFKPRGWGWVDPTKEVEAFKEAERAGYTTKTKIIAATGGGDDIEEVLQERRRELDMAAALGLEFDTDKPEEKAAPAAEPAEPEPEDDEEQKPMRIVK